MCVLRETKRHPIYNTRRKIERKRDRRTVFHLSITAGISFWGKLGNEIGILEWYGLVRGVERASHIARGQAQISTRCHIDGEGYVNYQDRVWLRTATISLSLSLPLTPFLSLSISPLSLSHSPFVCLFIIHLFSFFFHFYHHPTPSLISIP